MVERRDGPSWLRDDDDDEDYCVHAYEQDIADSWRLVMNFTQ